MVWNTLYVVLCFSVYANAVSISYKDVIVEEWEAFKSRHGKNYADKSEENFRLKVFMENKHLIAKHNQRNANGLESYTLAMNEFGDLLNHEFVSFMNGYKKSYKTDSINGSTYLSPKYIQIPDAIDWRKEGYVTGVKNQGQCGSCWAFSSTGSLEGQHFRKTGKLVSLSEQNLVDCSGGKYGNNGCEGGLMDNAFQYIKENRGIDTESSYPYLAQDERCHFKSRNIGATDTGFVDIEAGNEEQLKEAVASVGPVSVAIDAGHDSFQFYSGGVYNEKKCSTEDLDHGVLVVGFGTTADNVDYWIVKNSWGTNWGEKGYIRMSRNKNNQCGIASQASYPLV